MLMYLDFKQNDVDPSPEARAQVGAAVDSVFKFAEYALVEGVFVFLAKETDHWAVEGIAGVLALMFSVFLLSLISGVSCVRWKDAEHWWSRILLFFVDSSIFAAIFIVLLEAMKAVLETMSSGIGI